MPTGQFFTQNHYIHTSRNSHIRHFVPGHNDYVYNFRNDMKCWFLGLFCAKCHSTGSGTSWHNKWMHETCCWHRCITWQWKVHYWTRGTPLQGMKSIQWMVGHKWPESKGDGWAAEQTQPSLCPCPAPLAKSLYQYSRYENEPYAFCLKSYSLWRTSPSTSHRTQP